MEHGARKKPIGVNFEFQSPIDRIKQNQSLGHSYNNNKKKRRNGLKPKHLTMDDARWHLHTKNQYLECQSGCQLECSSQRHPKRKKIAIADSVLPTKPIRCLKSSRN